MDIPPPNKRVPPLSALSLAVDVQLQMAASKDTVIQSERILQDTDAILSAESPRDTQTNDSNTQPIIPVPTPQQTAEHSVAVHHDITYAKHYLAQTQERLQHSNKQDPIEDPLKESLFNPKKFYNNETVASDDGLFLAVESVGHTTGVLSKSVQEQIKASKSMMQRSEAMMDSLMRSKSIPNSNSRSSSPLPQPPTLPPPSSFRNTPSPSTPPSRSPPPIPTNNNNNNNIDHDFNKSESDNADDLSHLRKIYHGKNSRPPSASLDKIMSYTTPTVPTRNGRQTPPISTTPAPDTTNENNFDYKNNNNNNNNNSIINNNNPKSISPTPPRSASSLSKPHLSMPPPLLYPPPSSPTFFSYTPTGRTTPEQSKYGNDYSKYGNGTSKTGNTPSRNSRPASPSTSYLPSSSSSTYLPSSSQFSSSTPASAARSLHFPASPTNVRASSPSLPISELSRLDLSTPPPQLNSNPYSSSYHSTIPKTYSSSYTPNSTLYSSQPNASIPSSFSNSSHLSASKSFSPTPSSGSITVAMVSALSSQEREEYVQRIKDRNKRASLSGDSLLDKFFSERSYT